MLKNHLKIAWRNLRKDGLFTAIKIGGFAIGISACLLILFFIKDEVSYDTHYANKDHLYRVVMEGEMNGEVLKSVHFQLLLAETLQSEFPEITKAGKINTSELFGAGKKGFRPSNAAENNLEDGFIFGDQQVVELLELQLLEGNPKQVLTQPNSILISEDKAKKYFPNGNALGQSIVLDNDTENPYMVSGVMKNVPKNSHLQFSFLLPIEDTNGSWTTTNYFTYVKLDPDANANTVADKMHSILEKYFIPRLRERTNDPVFLNALKTLRYTLQPITDIHLKSDVQMGDGLPHGDIRFVWLFAAIAGFILLLATINFINLSTAKSANRGKEVGLRKTVGAFKSNLIMQFLVESVLFSLFSFVLAVLLTWSLLPVFNDMVGKSIVMPWATWWFVPFLLVMALCVGMLAGVYPAFYLSSFKPVNVLKGKLSLGSKSGKLRSGLVVFQFTTSVILIVGTIIIYKQMNYILHKDIGYNKEQVVILEGADVLGDKALAFREQLEQLAEVTITTQSDYLPVDGGKRNGNTFTLTDDPENAHNIPSQIWRVDYNYITTLGMQVDKGRDFSKQFASDATNGIIINTKMASEMGIKDPLGKQINNGQDWTIIGVVNDFNYKSLKEDVQPLTLVLDPNNKGDISIKLNTQNLSATLNQIKELWEENVPDQAFNYVFLDEEFSQMHEDVQRMGKIFNSFAIFAILVASLGLFALSAFMIEQRKKEISIRIVLGAPFKSIYQLLTLDFMKLIFISILIAIPIGWYMMQQWLQDFAYRITIGAGVFIWAGGIVLGVALLTISYQSIRAALIEPTKSLKSE